MKHISLKILKSTLYVVQEKKDNEHLSKHWNDELSLKNENFILKQSSVTYYYIYHINT